MFYIGKDGVYEKVDGGYRNVAIMAKDKVIEVRELESITVERDGELMKNIEDETPYSLEMLIKKFNISENNPIPYAKGKVTKTRTKKQ